MMNSQSDISGRTARFGVCALALERHEQRRRQGVPTLSVLVGPADACAAAWLEWTAAANRGGSIEEWLTRNWLSGSELLMMTQDATAAEEQVEPPQTKLFVPPREVGGVTGLGERQILRVLQEAADALVARMEALSERRVPVAFALAVSAEMAKTFLRDAPECRAKALFREGLIELPAPSVREDGHSPAKRNGDSLFQDAARTALALTQQQASASTLGRFQEATFAWKVALAAPKDRADAATDRARSAAERFLFELLNELPETKGIFALNGALDFCFGPKPMEIDLISKDLRIAVEIDGYRHFQDSNRYRRDRRKDVLLQIQGYLVLRFLAEDAVTRLEDILDQVRETVAFRRVTMQKRGGESG